MMYIRLHGSPLGPDDLIMYRVTPMADDSGVGILIYASSKRAAKKLLDWIDSGSVDIYVTPSKETENDESD